MRFNDHEVSVCRAILAAGVFTLATAACTAGTVGGNSGPGGSDQGGNGPGGGSEAGGGDSAGHSGGGEGGAANEGGTVGALGGSGGSLPAGGAGQAGGSNPNPMPGAGGAPTAAACPAGNICDDFENGTVGQMPAGWVRASGPGGRVTLAESRAFSGKKALAIEADGAAGTLAFAMKRGAPLFPVAGNRLFGRMMVYFDSIATDGAHWTNIQGEGVVVGKTYTAQYRYGGQGGHIMANYETSGIATDCFKHSGVIPPTGQWLCYQWEFNGPQNEMRFWFNGEEVPSMHILGFGQGCVAASYKEPWYAPQFQSIALGWQHFQATTAHKMWIDDVALGGQATPCPPMKTF